MEDLFRSLDDGEAHYAKEVTVGAVGVLSPDNRLYSARAILASGDCKFETGDEHAQVIQTTLDGLNDVQDKVKLRIVSIASDGEARRGLALARLTFKSLLSPTSPIYPLLSPLIFMNLHVGPDDITCDKDWKHIFKRFRNLFLRARGVNVHGYRTTPDIMQDHFRSEGHSAEHINATFNPKDQQDVKVAFDMLKDLWTLPRSSKSPRPGAQAAREALWTLGLLAHHLVFPFLCVDLSLSEQLEHLSAAAHLLLVLYEEIGKSFIPTELFIDVMLMIKNVYFCVAKSKVDDPKGVFYIILLGTDRLETLFGILRTIVGNDANLDMLQIVSRLTGTTEISNILARFPHWDRSPRRLKIPVISRDSKEIADSADHIKPGLWRGDVHVELVSLHSSWKRGRSVIEKALPFAKAALLSFEARGHIDILSPHGKLIINTPLRDNDLDESIDESPTTLESIAPAAAIECLAENRVEVENVIAEASLDLTGAGTFSRTITVNGKEVNKSRALARYSKYRKVVSSTDRLRRVQDVERYISTYSNSQKLLQRVSNLDDEEPLLLVSDPVASIVCCEEKAWLCLGEVNGLKVDGDSVDFLPHSLLPDERTIVSFQILGLRPATTEDDDSQKFDWRSCRLSSEHTYAVPGRLIQPVNLDLATGQGDAGNQSFYLADSRVLVSLAASHFQTLATLDLKTVPTIAPKSDFPYREATGKACFMCSDDSRLIDFGNTNSSECSHCSADVILNLSQGQRVLEHIAAHILHDPRINQACEPCGLCLQPFPQCQFFVKKGSGARAALKVDRSTGCPRKVKFLYNIAAESTNSSPCTNVPMICPICPTNSPAVWKYNLQHHLKRAHPSVDHTRYADLYALESFERDGMTRIWEKRQQVSVKRPKKSNLPALVVSEAHRSQIASTSTATEPVIEVNGAQHNDSGAPGAGSHERAQDSDEGALSAVPFEEPEADPPSPLPIPSCTEPDLSDPALVCRNESAPMYNSEMNQDPDPVEEGLTRMVVESSGRSKRKRTAFTLTSLRTCLCGEVIEDNENGVVECRRANAGCETGRYHLNCIDMEGTPRNWTCEACLTSREGKRAR